MLTITNLNSKTVKLEKTVNIDIKKQAQTKNKSRVSVHTLGSSNKQLHTLD